MDNIIDIEKISSKIEEDIKQSIKGCIIRPSVAVIEIGKDEISEISIKALEDACNRVGIYFRYFEFEDNVPELTIINKIKELNNDEYVNGIMIMQPIPDKYNEKRLLNTIVNSKDINGLTDINIGRLISGRKTIAPCTSIGIMTMFKEYNIELDDKEVVILCDKKSIIRPLVSMLINSGATVTVCNSNTKDLNHYVSYADIVISALNKEEIITSDMIKKDAIVIDSGCSIQKNEIVGDVDFDNVSKKASLITPKVNGIDPMTISMFLNNILFCYNSKK